MTPKLQALLAAIITGGSGFISWLVSLPPENQDAVIKPLIELTPLHWRPTIGLISRGIASIGLIYAAYKAANSNHATPLVTKAILIFLMPVFLVGCETVTHADGSVSERFDAKAATDVVNLGFNSYDRYRSYQNP